MRMPTLSDAAEAFSLSSAVQQRLTGNFLSEPPTGQLVELPGDAPFSLCPVSRSTDLFEIKYVELTKQPVYIDDDVLVYMYGSLQREGMWPANATINTTVDCGSHCEVYGNPLGERPSESFTLPFCEISYIEPGLGGGNMNATCEPVQGQARITSLIYVFPMFLNVPGWYNFTFDAKTAEGERIYCLMTEVCLRWQDPKKNENYPEGPWSRCRWPR